MKKMLLKLSSAFLVVAFAGTSAFAQSQSSTDQTPEKRSFKAASAVKVVESESVDKKADIYREVDSSARSTTKSGQEVARPIVKKRSGKVQTSQATERVARPVKAKTVAERPASAPTTASKVVENAEKAPKAVKTRVSNVHKAKPADYKAPSNGSKTEEK